MHGHNPTEKSSASEREEGGQSGQEEQDHFAPFQKDPHRPGQRGGQGCPEKGIRKINRPIDSPDWRMTNLPLPCGLL
jgi:hypothetical protein